VGEHFEKGPISGLMNYLGLTHEKSDEPISLSQKVSRADIDSPSISILAIHGMIIHNFTHA
jgi:hypothetical protein